MKPLNPRTYEIVKSGRDQLTRDLLRNDADRFLNLTLEEAEMLHAKLRGLDALIPRYDRAPAASGHDSSEAPPSSSLRGAPS